MEFVWEVDVRLYLKIVVWWSEVVLLSQAVVSSNAEAVLALEAVLASEVCVVGGCIGVGGIVQGTHGPRDIRGEQKVGGHLLQKHREVGVNLEKPNQNGPLNICKFVHVSVSYFANIELYIQDVLRRYFFRQVAPSVFFATYFILDCFIAYLVVSGKK